ncbi:MAG: asparagine synthase (glutamine-hydrolyzing) [Dokdonella sp.]
MCGIAGFSGAPLHPSESRALLERMIHTLRHRGPDGFGFHVEDATGLAHARLSIIDHATGAQPMANADDSTWVVFNGEIFNYLELREDLIAAGYRFRTRSDTEVLVHLYDRHGDRFVDYLNGQFAIALWDARRQRLLLVRDRAGIRPLFYTRAHGRIWFGSEIKALLAVLPERARLNPDGLVQTFTFWAPLEPDSLFEGVHSLPAGHLLSIEADGRETLHRYWDWSFPAATAPPAFTDIDSAAAELRALLTDAVALQLRADVPVGAYLSGGLDSSTLVALMQQLSGQPARTFSLTFVESEFDESAEQQTMVRHLGSDHSSLVCSRHDIGLAFPRLITHTETPVLRTAPVPLMLLAAHVRQQGFKVVMSGEGADEVFAGYDLFKEAKVRRFWARQPDSRWRPLLLGRLYGYLANSPVANAAFAQSFFGQGMEHLDRPVFAHVPRWRSSQRALGFLSPELRASTADFDPLALFEARLPADIGNWAPLAQDQYVEAKSLLATYLLSAQGDRVAASHSIEARMPFLDHRLIEFANRLPPQWKIRGLTEKYLLRLAVADLLPASIAQRVKQPYRAPDSASFFANGEPLDYVAELMGGERIRSVGYFDAKPVGRLLDKCRSGRAIGFADNQAFVGILSTMLMHDQFIRRWT